MISIIICSRDSLFLNKAIDSISNTIGVIFEIVLVENIKNNYTLCEAYNLGASRSKYDILCFVHEDVLFHTVNWGKILADIIKVKKVGLVGVIGGTYKSKLPSGWWDIPTEYKRMSLLQVLNDGTIRRDIINPKKETSSEVVSLDGVFLCMRKEVWQEFSFNENEIKGFHFYDLDISLRVGQKYSLVVAHQILLEHFSEGNINLNWVNTALNFHRKWSEHLPMYTNDLRLDRRQIQKLEYKACKALVNYCIANNSPYKLIFSLLLQCFKFDLFNRDNLWLLKKYFQFKLS